MQVKPPTPNLRVWRSFIVGWTLTTFAYGFWVIDGTSVARGLARFFKRKKSTQIEGKNEPTGTEEN